MYDMLLNGIPVAQNGGGDGYSSWLTLFTLWLPILIIFYLLLIRPQRREQRKREMMLKGLKKNDRVVTIGGIYGVVLSVHPEADEVTLRVDETTNTKLRVTLGAIARVLAEEPADTGSKKGQ